MDKKKQLTKKNKTIIVIAIIIMIVAVIFMMVGITSINKTSKNDQPKPSSSPSASPSPTPEVELDETQKKALEMAKKFHSYLVDTKKTREDFETLTGITKNYFAPMVGKDSLLKTTYPEEMKSQIKEDITKYEKEQTKDLKTIADYLKKNYKYKIVDYPIYTEDKKQLVQQTTITPYSYELLKKDVQSMRTKLLKMANAPELEEKPEPLLYYYKANTIALKIIANNLEEYKNKQKFEENIVFNVGEDGTVTCQNCDTYINYCVGIYVDAVSYKDGIDYYNKNYEARIDKMIKKAQDIGTIDKDNPLKLK